MAKEKITTKEQPKMFNKAGGSIIVLVWNLDALVTCEADLSKVIDHANQTVFFDIHQVIKYVFNTRSLGLKLESKRSEKEMWTLCVSVIVTTL